jgi:hypothetical protein
MHRIIEFTNLYEYTNDIINIRTFVIDSYIR